MFQSRIRTVLTLGRLLIWGKCNTKKNELRRTDASYSAVAVSGSLEFPRKLKRTERKPLVTSVNELKRREREEKQKRREIREVALKPPDNGMLVEGLIPVAHHVLAAKAELVACVSRVVEDIPVYSCRLCGEVHVGHTPHKILTCSASQEHVWERGCVKHVLPLVESFHMYDRLGRAISHNERLEVDRIPAIMELCIQAGVDVPDYQIRRRKFPVYQVAGKMIDFEKKFPKDDLSGSHPIQASGFWGTTKRRSASNEKTLSLPHHDDLKEFAVRGMEAWEKMRSGATQLMQKYAVQTCGYCPEVQVGPKGHRVRQCQAFKHQMRDGQHAWQEATVDDLVPPVYVWHVQDPHSGPLVDALKRYYGKLPAVVEMFAQAGAQVGCGYNGVMRADVALPSLDEEKLVV